ncbi:MAG TPA: hypothetical protein DIC64_04755 [Alphaproteobacteria bacterium]|nr:hypothetical protein [Alphaproteobacteria bacterium]
MTKPILAAIVSVSSTVLTDDEKRLLEKANPLGVSLFARNLKTKTQIKSLTKAIKEVIGRDDVIIALDEEGGRVNRLKSAGFCDYASQKLLGRIDRKKITKAHAELISADMKSVGANFNFAPCLDIEYKDTSNALKTRCLAKSVRKISEHGKILWQTYQKNGICPCIKHLPGHGRANTDPHLNLPVLDFSVQTLEQDFAPFIYNKDCPAAMTAHILLPKVDSKYPVTMSKKGVQTLIRGLIGYQGFLISDALEMHALKGSIPERVNTSLDAGVDAVCYCLGDFKGLQEVVSTKRFLTDVSLERFSKIQNILKTHNTQTNLDLFKQIYYSKLNLFEEERVNYDATEVLFKLNKGVS